MQRLRNEIVELQEKTSDGVLGRDAFTRAQDQIRQLEATFRGARADMLAQEINILGLSQRGNNVPQGSAEALKFDQETAAKRKELRDAEFQDDQRDERLKVVAAGETSAAQIAAAQRSVAASAAAYGVGSEEYKRAQEQLAEASRRSAEQATEAERKQVEDQVKAEQDKTRRLISADEDAVKRRVMAQSEASAAIIARYQEELAAVDRLYDQEAALADRTGQKRQEALSREAQFNREIAEQIQSEQQKSADATQKAWTTTATQIESAFNSQLRGLLEGTTSWGSAAKNILKDFVTQGIEGFEKLAVNFLVQQTVMNSAASAGSALRLAAEQTASSGGIAALLANAVRAITVDAGQTAAGVSAWFAPFLGPPRRRLALRPAPR